MSKLSFMIDAFKKTQCTVGYQKSPDSLFFKTLNRIYLLSSDHKRMNNSLLDSPNQDASDGSKFMFLASIDNE